MYSTVKRYLFEQIKLFLAQGCATWSNVVTFLLQLKASEFFRLKSIRREIEEEEKVTEERKAKRAKAKEDKLLRPAMLSGYKFEEKVS